MRVEPDFEDEIAGIAPEDIDDVPHVIYGLRPDLSVGMVNERWFKSGGGPDAPVPKGSIIDALPRPVQTYYRQLYAEALRTREVIEHEYLCHTPKTWRRFTMRCSPLKTGLLVTHVLEERRPHTLKRYLPDEKYRDADGLVKMCAHCRRVHNPGRAGEWRWIPDWVRESPPRVSHGLCPPCVESYYGSSVA